MRRAHNSVHAHPRSQTDRRETLATEVHDAVVAAIRSAAPDLEISCSTQEDFDSPDSFLARGGTDAVGEWPSPLPLAVVGIGIRLG
jgi:hypothetical protein